MRLYGYYNNNGVIETAEVEVKERVILVPENDNVTIPFIYGKSIDRDRVGELMGWDGTVFYMEPSFELAKEKFADKVRKEYTENKKNLEQKKAVLERLEKQEDANADQM